MPIGKDYRLTIGSGREALPPADDREGAAIDLRALADVVAFAHRLRSGKARRRSAGVFAGNKRVIISSRER